MLLSNTVKQVLQLVVKAFGVAAGFVSASLVFTYHNAIFTAYEKIVLCGIFGGFLALYLAFFISTLMRRPVEADLNTIWALYGVAAYLGAGCMCLTLFTGRGDNEASQGFISGLFGVFNAAFLFADVVIMQIL